VRTVRLCVKAANLMTRNYVAEGPPAVFVASAAPGGSRRPAPPRPGDDRARARCPSTHARSPLPGQP
jgi:hypothetical protein